MPYISPSPEELAQLRLLEAERQIKREEMSNTRNAPTLFSEENYDNLIKWQLDIKEELARIEHLLRKHVPKTDTEGNIYYEEPTKENQLFNEMGINEIMNLLAWYLNKNIILSNFGEDEIKIRCWQFSQYLSDFIFNNYQKFGLDTKEKIKHYPMIVMNVTNTIEAAYNRALNGGERESLRTARQVHQSEPISNPYGTQNNRFHSQQKKSLFKPWTW